MATQARAILAQREVRATVADLERAASTALAAGTLERVGKLEIPVPYWMFALRARDLEPFAMTIAKAASALA